MCRAVSLTAPALKPSQKKRGESPLVLPIVTAIVSIPQPFALATCSFGPGSRCHRCAQSLPQGADLTTECRGKETAPFTLYLSMAQDQRLLAVHG